MLTALGLGFFVLLATVVLPLARVRQATLAFAARAGQATALAVVAACGTLFVRPDAVPTPTASLADRLADGIRDQLPDVLSDWPGIPWLVVAVAVVIVALPVVSVLDFAARVTGHTAAIQALRKDLRAAAAVIDQRLSALVGLADPTVTTELAAAAEAVRVVAGGPKTTPMVRAKLVRDLI